jgi:hypothetical protein
MEVNLVTVLEIEKLASVAPASGEGLCPTAQHNKKPNIHTRVRQEKCQSHPLDQAPTPEVDTLIYSWNKAP